MPYSVSSETNSELTAGIDFGGTKMLGVVIDSGNQIVATHRVATPYEANQLLDAVAQLMNKLQGSVGGHVGALGVGAAGMVDLGGTLCFGPNVGHLANLNILEGVTQRLPQHRIHVENDALGATWAEKVLGAGKDVSDMTMVTLGTGIGGGHVFGGQVFRGPNGFAGEIGHMTVQVDGIECICGKIGCWEAYSSGRGLGRIGREYVLSGRALPVLELAGAVEDIRGEHVTKAARAGNEDALEIMDWFARWVAVGVSNLITIIDPQLIVIAGGLAEESDLYLDMTNHHLNEIVHGKNNRPIVPVVKAHLGETAGAVGAAMLAREPL